MRTLSLWGHLGQPLLLHGHPQELWTGLGDINTVMCWRLVGSGQGQSLDQCFGKASWSPGTTAILTLFDRNPTIAGLPWKAGPRPGSGGDLHPQFPQTFPVHACVLA